MTGLGDVGPKDGVRISLSLTASSATDATYTCVARWSAPSGEAVEAHGSALVRIDPPGVEFTNFDAAPEATITFVRTLLRTTARSVQDARWPRRITRWRDDS